MNYELADLLLFDLATLKSSYALYLSSYQSALYAGLLINLYLAIRFKRNFQSALFFLGFSWAFPGYFFFIENFSKIYWPSQYIGLFLIAVGGLLVFLSFKPRFAAFPTAGRQVLFILCTLLPSTITYFYDSHLVLGLGTSVTVAALGTFSLMVFQRDWLARALVAISTLWIGFVGLISWALVYQV